MALSSKPYVGDGIQTDWVVTFNYLDRSHVRVRVNKVFTDEVGSLYEFTWINDTTVRVIAKSGGTPVPTDIDIDLVRNTPIDTPAVVFGGGASLTTKNLNKNSEYLTFALQEATDANEEFTKLYLGSFDTAPTSDNDGDTLRVGAVYYNSISKALFYWTGDEWIIGESTFAAETARVAAEVAQAASETARDQANQSVLDAQAEVTNAQGEVVKAEAEVVKAQVEVEKARLWAEEDEDVEVTPGKYSAKHFASKAATFDPSNHYTKVESNGLYMPIGGSQVSQAAPSFILENQQASGLGGGALNASGVQTLTLNTEVDDPNGIVNLLSNEFTVTENCWIVWDFPLYGIDYAETWLHNVTDAQQVPDNKGSRIAVFARKSAASSQIPAPGWGYLEAGKTYRIECDTASTEAAQAQGVTWSNVGVERYGYVMGWVL